MKPDKIKEIYEEEFINYNLRNILKSGCVDYGFIPVKDIKIPREFKTFKLCTGKNPYLHEDNAVENLANSILKYGTYWEIILNNGYLSEGNHRVIALKLGIKKGYIPEDFKLFYIDVRRDLGRPIDVYVRDNFYVESFSKFPCGRSLSVKDTHLHENKITSKADIAWILNEYAMYLKDLIYPYGCEIIPPSKVINDEEYFYEWLRK